MKNNPELRSVNGEIPDPPYDGNHLANGFGPDIELQKILASEDWLVADPLVSVWRLAALELAWVQCPMGTLPGRIPATAVLLRCGIDFLERNRDVILYDFALHSNGRIYHPMLTKQALRIISQRERKRKNTAKSRAKTKQEEDDGDDVTGQYPVTSRLQVGYGPDSNRPVTGQYPPSYSSSSSSSDSDSDSDSDKNPQTPKGGHAPETPIDEAHQDLAPAEPQPTKSAKHRKAASKTAELWTQAESLLDHLSTKSGHRFDLKNRKGEYTANAKLAADRIEEHGLETLLRVVDMKCSEWKNSPKWRKFLRPSTLFGKTNCEQYAGLVGTGETDEDDTDASWINGGPLGGNVIEGEFREVG